jgi:hypothetical protein
VGEFVDLARGIRPSDSEPRLADQRSDRARVAQCSILALAPPCRNPTCGRGMIREVVPSPVSAPRWGQVTATHLMQHDAPLST